MAESGDNHESLRECGADHEGRTCDCLTSYWAKGIGGLGYEGYYCTKCHQYRGYTGDLVRVGKLQADHQERNIMYDKGYTDATHGHKAEVSTAAAWAAYIAYLDGYDDGLSDRPSLEELTLDPEKERIDPLGY